MFKKIFALILMLLSGASVLSACGSGEEKKPLTYEQITPAEAKKLMDTEKDYIILDVRTQEEYDTGHIKNAILIPDYDIGARVESVIRDKDKLVLVYCRSGRRSKLAAETMVALGYSNVKEFGGIIDWKYETVTD